MDTNDFDTLRERVGQLERVCAEAYQFAGAVGAPARVLDNLSAAAEGKALPHASFLPVSAEECDKVSEPREFIATLRRLWKEFEGAKA